MALMALNVETAPRQSAPPAPRGIAPPTGPFARVGRHPKGFAQRTQRKIKPQRAAEGVSQRILLATQQSAMAGRCGVAMENRCFGVSPWPSMALPASVPSVRNLTGSAPNGTLTAERIPVPQAARHQGQGSPVGPPTTTLPAEN